MRWAQLSPAVLQTHILKWFLETCRVGMKFLCFTTTKSAFSAFYHQVTMFARPAWMAKQCRASFIMWQITRVSNTTQIIKHLEGFIKMSILGQLWHYMSTKGDDKFLLAKSDDILSWGGLQVWHLTHTCFILDHHILQVTHEKNIYSF